MAGDQHDHDHHSRLSDIERRVRAIESILVEKGYVDPAAMDVLVDTYETRIGPRNGAKAVAKAWTDPEFREWLLRDATAALASLGYAGHQGEHIGFVGRQGEHIGFVGRQGEHMMAVENTPDEHNMIVCTLCSCYPWPVLGLPPVWYKSAPYRSRAVMEPRAVLAEFGVALPETTRIRVWDSTAEVRYLVIPMRPEGSEGLDEEALAALVTRDSMIGTGLPLRPDEVVR